MKIIFKAENSDILEYFRGICEVLTYCGHEVYEWKNKPAFDIFDEIHPDLILVEDICYPNKCIKENPQVRSVVLCDNNSFDDYADAVVSTKINSPFSFLPKACNQFRYIKPKNNKMFDCDILYIGSNHPLIPKLCSISNDLKIKIFGENCGNEYYCGYIDGKLIGDAFHTANITLHLHETECSQQIFDILYCQGVVCSDITETTEEILYNYIWPLPEEDFIIANIKTYLINKDNHVIKDSHKFIQQEHTYFDRSIKLMNILGLDESHIIDKKEEFFNKIND